MNALKNYTLKIPTLEICNILKETILTGLIVFIRNYYLRKPKIIHYNISKIHTNKPVKIFKFNMCKIEKKKHHLNFLSTLNCISLILNVNKIL